MGYPVNLSSLAEILETGEEIAQESWTVIKGGLSQAGKIVQNNTGTIIKFTTGTGLATAGASSVAKSTALTVVTASEATSAAGAVTTTVTPAVAVSGAPFGTIAAGVLVFLGLESIAVDAGVKIFHQMQEYWEGDFRHKWQDQTGLYDELIRLYMDKDGKTYVDGTTIETMGNILDVMGAFDEAGYSNIDIPLNTVVKFDGLNFTDTMEFFKTKFTDLAPDEQKKELVNKAIDAFASYIINDLGLLPNGNNLVCMSVSSGWSQMRCHIYYSDMFNFTRYNNEYINTGVLSTSQSPIFGKFVDSLGNTVSHSIAELYTVGFNGDGSNLQILRTSNTTGNGVSFGGSSYVYTNTISKEKGFDLVRKIGIIPGASTIPGAPRVKFSNTAGDVANNSFPGSMVIPKVLPYPDLAPEAYPVIYPLTIPEIYPNGYPKPMTQEEAWKGTYPEPDDNPVVKVVIDNLPETPQIKPATPEDPVEVPDNIPIVLDPPVLPEDSYSLNNGFMYAYNPTNQELVELNEFLWSKNFLDNLQKLFSNPMDAIIGLHQIYIKPIHNSVKYNIGCGWIDTGVKSYIISSRYLSKNFGIIKLNNYFNNVLDYSPYTTIQLYLPYVGIVKLDTNEVMGGSIQIDYNIDFLTGAFLAQVTITRSDFTAILYTYPGNCAVQMPITGGSYASIIANTIGLAASVGATYLSGGALAPVALAGAASTLTNSNLSVEHSGTLSSNAGALGYKKPYLIITRKKPYNSSNYSKFYGYPSNMTVILSSCSGFTRVKDVHVENITGATDNELSEIAELLKEGVII